MTRWGGEFTWVPGGTCCELWSKEAERTGKCPACSLPNKEQRPLTEGDAPFDTQPWEEREHESTVFCAAPACGLTCKPGRARCWVHDGVG